MVQDSFHAPYICHMMSADKGVMTFLAFGFTVAFKVYEDPHTRNLVATRRKFRGVSNSQ